MNRYENGKIYKIVDVGYEKMYIGSTTEPLSKRMERHRSKYKEYLRGEGDNTRVYWLFDEFGVENCKIELIENYSCNSREELERQEGKHQKNNDCINKIIAGRTRKERYNDKPEYYLAQQNNYYKLHPEHKKEKGKKQYQEKKHILLEKHLCGCGKHYTFQHKKRHEQTKKHQDWLKQQEQE